MNPSLNLKCYFGLQCIFDARREYIGTAVDVTESENGGPIEKTMKS